MAIAKINANKCTKENQCTAELSCPIGAISRTKKGEQYEASVIDAKRCLGCGKCMRFCPSKAITVY